MGIVFLNEEDEYNIEGFAQMAENKAKFLDERELHYDYINDDEIIESNREYNYYSQHFYDREHYNFVGKLYDEERKQMENFVLSLKLNMQQAYIYILRTENGNKLIELEDNELSLIEVVTKLSSQEVKEIMPVICPKASGEIAKYDKSLMKKTFTFGIVYQKYGQLSEKEIFSNQSHSPEFDEFLDFIGVRVSLKNFKGFRGGLDTSSDSELESIYEQHDNSEIMFHVTTMLPYRDSDKQYVEKKRHIGNDKVAIVFQDEDSPFSPSIIKSKLLHVYILIQPIKIGTITQRYKISVVSKNDSPYFGPYVRKPFVFKKDKNLKKFLLTKLINAEYASLMAPGFKKYTVASLSQSLQNLCEDLKSRTLKFNNCLSLTSENSPSAVATFRRNTLQAIQKVINSKEPLTKTLSNVSKSDDDEDSKVIPHLSIKELKTRKKSKDIKETDIQAHRRSHSLREKTSHDMEENLNQNNKSSPILPLPDDDKELAKPVATTSELNKSFDSVFSQKDEKLNENESFNFQLLRIKFEQIKNVGIEQPFESFVQCVSERSINSNVNEKPIILYEKASSQDPKETFDSMNLGRNERLKKSKSVFEYDDKSINNFERNYIKTSRKRFLGKRHQTYKEYEV